MRKYGIPTARIRRYSTSSAEALAYLETCPYPAVVKADGLALGKGVLICEDIAAARAAIASIMEEKIFGASGSRVVIEEFLTGPEVSVLAFTDGKTVVPMVSSMDHKRALRRGSGPQHRRHGHHRAQSLLHARHWLSAAWKRFSCPPSAP